MFGLWGVLCCPQMENNSNTTNGASDELPLLIEVHRSSNQRAVAEAALVLQARHIDQRLGQTQDGLWALYVEEADGSRAKAELTRYRAENRNWPPRMALHEALPGAWMGSAWYILVLLAFFAFQTEGGGTWQAGVADASAILAGEWWLGFSALLLHADILHLVSNLVFGSLFGFLVAAEIGSGPAWFGILLAGGLGNISNAFLFEVGLEESHRSLGASTAVFGAVGILAVLEVCRRRGTPDSNIRKIAPMVFGVVLLGMYGIGGEDTDVTAHFAGFLSGCLLGGIAFILRPHLGGRVADVCSYGAGVLIVLVTVLTWSR